MKTGAVAFLAGSAALALRLEELFLAAGAAKACAGAEEFLGVSFLAISTAEAVLLAAGSAYSCCCPFL